MQYPSYDPAQVQREWYQQHFGTAPSAAVIQFSSYDPAQAQHAWYHQHYGPGSAAIPPMYPVHIPYYPYDACQFHDSYESHEAYPAPVALPFFPDGVLRQPHSAHSATQPATYPQNFSPQLMPHCPPQRCTSQDDAPLDSEPTPLGPPVQVRMRPSDWDDPHFPLPDDCRARMNYRGNYIALKRWFKKGKTLLAPISCNVAVDDRLRPVMMEVAEMGREFGRVVRDEGGDGRHYYIYTPGERTPQVLNPHPWLSIDG